MNLPSTDTVLLPEQRVPVIDRCDVLVVGGGAAGLSAAIAAKRQGADVILVERYGYLGGLASGGLIVLLLTLDDGAGRQVVAGLCQELVERLEARDACTYPPWPCRHSGRSGSWFDRRNTVSCRQVIFGRWARFSPIGGTGDG